jgi:hypothetical protein
MTVAGPEIVVTPPLGEVRGTLAASIARRHRTREVRFTAPFGVQSVATRRAADAHGLALALPEKVAVARPAGVGRALATYEIPIEGRDEWLAAARLEA